MNKCKTYLKKLSSADNNFISLDEVKSFLRINSASQNSELLIFTNTAIEIAERLCKTSLIKKTILLRAYEFSGKYLKLQNPPYISIESVIIDGETISNTHYSLDIISGELVFKTQISGKIIDITYNAGFEDVSLIPNDIKCGILSHISYMWDSETAAASIPPFCQSIYDAYGKASSFNYKLYF